MQDHFTANVLVAEAGQIRKPFRVAQVAAMLDVHQATVYRDIEAGRLKALRVGSGKGALRIMPDALKDYVALLEVRSVPVVSDGLTVDFPVGSVDLVAVERAVSGGHVQLTAAEVAFLGVLKARVTAEVAA
jgi:excisionase family DNA binding protein